MWLDPPTGGGGGGGRGSTLTAVSTPLIEPFNRTTPPAEAFKCQYTQAP